MKRIIAHLDMDAFFASLEEADSPIFMGKPIVVGSDPKEGYGRGVVSTANYKAREYGIKSAVPISRAWQLSQQAKNQGKPEVVFLPVDFARYIEASKQIFEIIKKYAEVVEPASIDEYYFDLSFANNYKSAEKICDKIRKEIKGKLKVTCSVGLGPNKLISKIAAGVKKPNGMFVVKESQVNKFLEPLSIREIPGIGPKTEIIFNDKGIYLVKDLKLFSEQDLHDILGKWGIDLYYKARGQDNSPLVENREAKSIGEQATFQYDSLNAVYIGEVFENICQGVLKSFLNSGFKNFKTVAITVRFSDFETKTSAKTLKHPSNNGKDFKIEALKLLLPYLDKRKNPKKKLIRLIGVRIEKLNYE